MANREHWGTRLGFILASAGSAIGLGNIWKFPYVAGENGGAAFVLVYILSVLIVGLPLVYTEIVIGKASQEDVFGAFKVLGGEKWSLFGLYCLITGVIILSFYSVVGGWTISYTVKSILGEFSHKLTAKEAERIFGDFIQNPFTVVFYHFLFMLLSALIVIGGIKKGIERWSKILMPLLFFILLFLVIFSVFVDASNGFKGLSYLFKVDFSKFSMRSILSAMGQAFFSLSLGMGIMVTYGSYLSEKDDVVSSGFYIVFLDTLIALLAGIAIFPIIFAYGFNPASGPGLTFQTLPMAFSKMPGGYIFSILFFLLLLIAALTSSISLLEVIISYLIDEKGLERKMAVFVGAGFIFLLGIPSAISFVSYKDGILKYFFNGEFFDLVATISSDYMLPVGGMIMGIFAGWIYKEKKLAEAFLSPETEYKFFIYNLWRFLIRFVSPVIIFLVFLFNIIS